MTEAWLLLDCTAIRPGRQGIRPATWISSCRRSGRLKISLIPRLSCTTCCSQRAACMVGGESSFVPRKRLGEFLTSLATFRHYENCLRSDNWRAI
jgi:hypothetical protein